MRKEYIPLGRLEELKNRDQATMIAYKQGKGLLDEYKVITYPSRAFMINALKKDKAQKALIKDIVGENMVIYSNFQK